MDNKRSRSPGGKKSNGWSSDALKAFERHGFLYDEEMESKFTLPTEPTESVDKSQEYPPIVTTDGKVDTDIDHLMVEQEDDYVDLPLQDIQSKFPKPRVVTVIEGSLDDDIDNLMNHDGTMTHSLVDAPKNFRPGDLKEINANKEAKKHHHHNHHRSFNKMEDGQSDESFGVKNFELVPANEQNNSSDKYPEDDSVHAGEGLELNGELGSKISTAEKSKTYGAIGDETEPISVFDPQFQNPLMSSTLSGVDVSGKEIPNTLGHNEYLVSQDEGFEVGVNSIIRDQDKEEVRTQREETALQRMDQCNNGNMNRKESSEAALCETKLETKPADEDEDAQVDVDLIENLTIMCTDAIAKLALAEKTMGHSEQHKQLLAMADVLKQRIPVEKRNKRFSLQQYLGRDKEGSHPRGTEVDSVSRRGQTNANIEAQQLVQNLLKQVARVENSGLIDIIENSKRVEGTDRKAEKEDVENKEDKDETHLCSPLVNTSAATKPTQSDARTGTEFSSTQTSRINLPEHVNISTALKVAGDSMTAAAKMAEALSVLVKSTNLTSLQKRQHDKMSSRARRVKEYIGRTHSKTTTSGGQQHLDSYQVYNVVELPSFEMDSRGHEVFIREEDISSLEELKSGSEMKSRNSGYCRPEVIENMLVHGHWEKSFTDNLSGEEYLDEMRHHEHRRRSRSCRNDCTRRGEPQIVWQSRSHQRRRSSGGREKEAVDISPKDEASEGESNSRPGSARDEKRRAHAKERHEKVEKRRSNSQEKEPKDIVLVTSEVTRDARRRSSRKSDRKQDLEKPPLPIPQIHHRDRSIGETKRSSHQALSTLSKPRENEKSSKQYRHKKASSIERDMQYIGKHSKLLAKKERRLIQENIEASNVSNVDPPDMLRKSVGEGVRGVDGDTCQSIETRNDDKGRQLASKGVMNDLIVSNRPQSPKRMKRESRVIEDEDVMAQNLEGREVKAPHRPAEATGGGATENDVTTSYRLSPVTGNETWSLPTGATSQYDSYFDRFVSSFKTWGPIEEQRDSTTPKKKKKNKAETDYIHAKLFGSMVDPDNRDSDFDSIEFNGNACVSLSKLVQWQYCSDSWSQEEDSEYDTSASGYESYQSKWRYEY